MAESSRGFYQTFGLIYQDRQKERSQLSDCGRGIILPPGPAKDPPK
jgi:hypothetical protein